MIILAMSRRSGPAVKDIVEQMGRAFARFDEGTQDSGHRSYGVEAADGRRLFLKTAGDRAMSPGGASHAERVEALRRTALLHREVDHPALVGLHAVLEAADGVVVVQDWFDGELLRKPRGAGQADDPRERFARLPFAVAATALDSVIDLHVELERAGWVAGDFYDGSLMYDFRSGRIKVIDLEAYHKGAYTNEVGRLPGSTRFMAPEEQRRGAVIDNRTTVFNLGRMGQILAPVDGPVDAVRMVAAAATEGAREDRPACVADLQRLWRDAVA